MELIEIKKRIGDGDLRSAFTQLRDHFELDSETEKSLLVLNSTYSGICQEYSRGTLNFDDFYRQQAKVTVGVLDIIEKLELSSTNAYKKTESILSRLISAFIKAEKYEELIEILSLLKQTKVSVLEFDNFMTKQELIININIISKEMVLSKFDETEKVNHGFVTLGNSHLTKRYFRFFSMKILGHLMSKFIWIFLGLLFCLIAIPVILDENSEGYIKHFFAFIMLGIIFVFISKRVNQ